MYWLATRRRYRTLLLQVSADPQAAALAPLHKMVADISCEATATLDDEYMLEVLDG